MSSPDDSRERVEQLLARVDRLLQQKVPPPRPPRWRYVLLGVGALAAIILLVSLVTGGGSSSGPSQTTAVPTALTTIAPSTTTPIVITLPPNPTNTSTTTTTTTTTTTSSTEAGATERVATFRNGAVTLEGSVADAATHAAVDAAIITVAGAATLVDHLVVAPGAPAGVTDRFLTPDSFHFVSVTTPFEINDLNYIIAVVQLMVAHPALTVDINGYTAGPGPADTDRALSQTHADRVFQIFTYLNIDPARLTHTGFGDAPADHSYNGSIELVLHHLAG